MLSLETQQTQSGSFKTKVAVAVAATAAIGIVAAVTLSSSDSVARKATGLFNIPEDIKGHFSGGQTSGEWTVQGKFHKFETANGDWQIDSKLTVEGPLMEGSETYTLVDNVLVMDPEYNDEAVNPIQCGTRENLPAYTKWANVLDNAETLVEANMGPELKKAIKDNCPAGSTSVAVVVEERSYVICADSTANTRAMYAFNEDFSFSAVSRQGMTVDIQHPEGWEALNCTTFDASKTRDEAAQMSGVLADDSDRELAPRYSGDGDNYGGGNMYGQDQGGGGGGGGYSNYALPDQKKCAFFHGVGGAGSSHNGLEARFDDYWGPNRLAKRCSNTRKYIDTDTRTRGYKTLGYHREICNSLFTSTYTSYGAQSHNYFPNNGASNSVIFTHSMGGLSTRKTFANGVCSWAGGYYMSQAPMSGSKAANFASGACLIMSAFQVGWLIKWIMFGAYCNPVGLLSHYGYQTIYNGLPNYGNGGARAHGRLCGSQWSGLGGGISIILGIIQLFAGLQRRNDWCIIPQISCGWRGCRTSGCFLWWRCPYNDGMVAWRACGKNGNGTGKGWKLASTNIKRMGINHGDGTGRNGDRSGGASIDNWFKARSMLNFSEGTGLCQSCLCGGTGNC